MPRSKRALVLSALAAVALSPALAGLTDVEKADLLFMREEEKLARDVYQVLLEKWEMRIFENISEAEQRHMDAILKALERHGLEDPVGDAPRGKFANKKLQKLHDELVARGSESLLEALRVGALIEETDIADLDRAIARSESPDLVQLWERLNKGSRNHMRAFYGQLESRGVIYEPTELDAARLKEIVEAPWERGQGHGHGRGQGHRGGHGRRHRGGQH